MTDIVPAWAEEFFDDGPGPALSLAFPGRLTRSWAYGDGTGRGVRVAVIDSGIEDGHPLVGKVQQAIAVEDSDDDEVEFVEGPHDDLYGHGTACAGLIRAMAPEVELVSVRVLGPDLKGSAYTFAHGLEWCIEHGVNVVNLSLSTANEDYAETFYELIDQATHRNVMVVSAMNNERKRSIPSEFAGVFSVACCEGSDRERFLRNPALRRSGGRSESTWKCRGEAARPSSPPATASPLRSSPGTWPGSSAPTPASRRGRPRRCWPR